MSDPPLRTKLYIAPARSNLVARARLTRRIEDGLTRPLILIAAPAGFGKTTLLSEWRAREGREFPLAWLSLDGDDNDPVRFLTYLIAALETLRAGIGERALALLHSLQPSPPKAVLTTLISDLRVMPVPFALVLDDYHAVSAQAVHDAVAFLLDHLPPCMHLIVTSRADPPFPLGRMRANNLLTEIRADDLRFTPDEIAAFMNRVTKHRLAPSDVAALAERTEGWIAGLQLAALALDGAADVGAFLAAFAEGHHYVIDYLTEEVLRRLPESIQTFLLETSILDTVCGSLSEAVTGRPDSQSVLETLERSNVFTVRLDDASRWYRYHHLFAEMLRNRLRQAPPDRLFELHRRASAWYEGEGFGAQAVRHALHAKDFERAARLLEDGADAAWVRGEVTVLRGWLEALPKALIGAHPRLGLLFAWSLLLGGQPDAAEAFLHEIERRLDAGSQGRTKPDDAASTGPWPRPADIRGLRGEAAVIKARIARIRDDLPASIALCREALEDLPPQNLAMRSVVALNLGIAYRHSGDIAAAVRALAEAGTIGESAGNLAATVAALAQLGDLEVERGRLRDAARTYGRALDKSRGHGGTPAPLAAWAVAGLAEVMRERNELDAAGHRIAEGLDLATQWGNPDCLAWVRLHAARLKSAQGRTSEAAEALLEAEQVARHNRVSPWTLAEVTAYQARRWVDQGNTSAAARWAHGRGVGVDDDLTYLRGTEHLVLARLLIAERKPDAALRLLGRLLEAAEKAGLGGAAIEVLAVESLVRQARGQTGAAMIALARALSLAEPEGYIRIFVDEGAPMAALLREAESRGMAPEYVRTLLAAFGETAPRGSSASLLAEPLSERELEVVRLVASGLSTQEIAERLFIAVSTVRNHLKSIYGKLDAHSRVQAVERARLMKLL